MTESHDDIQELLGAYALDALDEAERDEVEAHLAGCPRCTAEVSDHREVAAMLAHTGEHAPEGVWSRIQESLVEVPPALQLPLSGVGRGGPPSTAPAPVASLGDRRVRRDRRARSRWAPLGAAAAAVVLVLGLLGGVLVAGGSGDGRGPSEQAAASLEEVARSVLASADARKVTFASGDGDLTATAAIDAEGSGYLLGQSLPALGEAETYQLWGVTDDVVVSLGVLGASPRVVAFHVDEGVDALVITREVAGGVPVSSNPPLLAGEVG